jgi:hypothetical protein
MNNMAVLQLTLLPTFHLHTVLPILYFLFSLRPPFFALTKEAVLVSQSCLQHAKEKPVIPRGITADYSICRRDTSHL